MLRTLLRCLFLGLVLVAGPAARAGEGPRIRADLVYGRKDGMALTLDVIAPPQPSGAAVLWIQSGGWYSNWTEPKNLLAACRPLHDKGFTVVVLRHASAPRYAVPDAVADVRRGVRYVRHRAKDLGLDADRLGALGGSAGGHLALMLATTGDDGDPQAKDPVLRHGSRVAAAVAFYPPTDLRGWTTDPPVAIKKVPALKPPLAFDAAKEKDVSPLLHVGARAAPALMIHGDKDELVPIAHSRNLLAALKTAGAPADLVVIEGAGHGFSPEQNRTQVVPAMVGWFEKHLAAPKDR